MDVDDQQLLRAFVEKGSEEAFCALVTRHADLVSRIAHKRLDNGETAKEVVQEVFCCLATKAPQLIKHPTISGWLVRVAVLESHRAKRTEARRMKRESTHAEVCPRDPDDESFSEDDLHEVEEALAALPKTFRNAIMLRYYEQASFKSIGKRLGKSEGAAQKLVARGIERLRRKLPSSSTNIGALLTSALIMRPGKADATTPIATAALQALAAKGSTSLTLLFMTSTQLKLMVGLGIAVLIPITYQWTKKEAGTHAEGEEALSSSVTPLAVESLTQSRATATPALETATPAVSQTEPRTPEQWRTQRFMNLIADLSDEEWKIRRGAAGTLKNSEVPGELAVPALAEALADVEWQVRKEVALALATYGEEATEAVPVLIKAMDDDEWHVRNASAMALISIPDKEAVPALSAALEDEQWHVAANAATALGAIGPDAKASIENLTQALRHEQWHVRNGAAYALGALGATETVDLLRAHLSDEEERVVETVREALSVLEPSP